MKVATVKTKKHACTQEVSLEVVFLCKTHSEIGIQLFSLNC